RYSWKPYQGDSLNPPDHMYSIYTIKQETRAKSYSSPHVPDQTTKTYKASRFKNQESLNIKTKSFANSDIEGLGEELRGVEGLGEELRQSLRSFFHILQQYVVEKDLMNNVEKGGVEKRCVELGNDVSKGVDSSADKVKFGYVNDEMLDSNDGYYKLKLPSEQANSVKSSYASMAKNQCVDKKLMLIPTEIGTDGVEVVIFDEEIVKEGKPKKLPLWVKLKNLSLEAWSIKGLSTIASRIVTPLIMDQITSNMCKVGTERVGFARVLIKVEASKGLPDTVEIEYMISDRVCLVTMTSNCSSKPKTDEKIKESKKAKARKGNVRDDFVKVNHRKKNVNNTKGNIRNETKIETCKNPMMYKLVEKKKAHNGEILDEVQRRNGDGGKNLKDLESPRTSHGWNVNKSIIESIRKSSNKYS
nr:RNA-directed DNA polymerase, eukaryota, reverse transcriptase zinc-binding domain protein [Tanacetum cinerariifolium]